MTLHRKIGKLRSINAFDPVWESMAMGVRRTGTGPTRLVDWLPAEKKGPVLVEAPRKSDAPASQAHAWTWVETLVLAAYALVAGVGIAWHEPWADEAQAWLMARDSGWWQMMLHGVRYEGSPGLWQTLLWILARLHVGYMGMHWVAGAVAAAGVVVLLRYSPIPVILRVLLPFGFWLAYQDAIVARSYVLFAALGFGAAALLRGLARWPVDRALPRYRLLWLAVLLGLIANISVHGCVASVGLALATTAMLRRRAKAGQRERWVVPALALGALWAIALATMIPPSDVNFVAGTNLEKSTARIQAKMGDAQAKADLQADIFAKTNDVRPGELIPVTPVSEHWSDGQAAWHKVARGLSLITYPVSNFRALALLACVLVVLQALLYPADAGSRAGPLGWIGLLPWALMVAVFTSMYLAPRHAGMLWTALVISLWLTWPAETATTKSRRGLQHVIVAVLAMVACDQIYWTAHSVRADVHGPYDGSKAMARFLKSEGAGKRIAGFYYYTVGPAAWFHAPVYFNQPHAYWIWSRNVRTVQQAPAAIATHPDVIVVGGMNWDKRDAAITDDWVKPEVENLHRPPLGDGYGVMAYAEAHGYRETHRFCGRAFMRDGWAEELCDVALEPR